MLPLYLIGSGLPTIRALIGKSKTYAERMFVYEPIGPLAKFDVRFDRITPVERQFLRAMADLPDAGGVGISALADALGKPPSAISMTRRSLIRKGMIYSPQLGTIAYTVPMFAQYMLRIMPSPLTTGTVV